MTHKRYRSPEAKKRWTENLSAAMHQSSLRRKCPRCNRKNALNQKHLPGYILKQCRYCDYVAGRRRKQFPDDLLKT